MVVLYYFCWGAPHSYGKSGNSQIWPFRGFRKQLMSKYSHNCSPRYIKLQNGLSALLISDLNNMDGAPSALSSEGEDDDDESEDESDEDDDSGAEIEDDKEDYDDEDCDDEEEEEEGENDDGEELNDPDSELEELVEKEETRKRGCTEKQVCINAIKWKMVTWRTSARLQTL